MALVKHSLVKYQFQPNSFSSYQHYCECECGWQCRVGTEVAAKSQFDNHLEHHGQKAHFKNLPVENEKGAENQVWKPAFNS